MYISLTTPEEDVEIRHLEQKDKEIWKELWTTYVTEHDPQMPDHVIELTWSRLMTVDKEHESRGLVILDDEGTVAGIAHYLFHRHGWTENDVCYIQDIYIKPAARRRGYARALFRKIFDIAETNQSKLIYWMAEISNDGARKLYDEFGEVSTFVRYWKTDM